ncbi:MAG TPA: neuraminidase (sialidase)-like protein [Candidatus Hydrogenedentes bacterium]|nr:neuraminidase (sialidase)-like protein [Candidatus Hydrogenedentota bacterium]
MKTTLALALMTAAATATAEQPLYEEELIFDPKVEDHGHVHASCIVECPNGDLRAVWYENGPKLPPPYFSEQQDKSADVRIGGGRKPAGVDAWEKPFVMHDTFGVSDNNPCMVVDHQERLWLVHATLLAVPQRSWASALLRYHISTDYARPGPPNWLNQNILPIHPNGFEKALMASFFERAEERDYSEEYIEKRIERVREQTSDVFKRRLGWMPRAHPLVRSDGTVIVPVANENFGIAAMVMSDDGGQTWTIGEAVPGMGLIQPTVVEYPDGHMTAFFRNSHPARRIVRSESTNGGMTWSTPTLTDLLHPGSGIEALLLDNGHLLMIYNNTENDPRDSLAVSVSTDRGETWTWTRHIENTPGGRFDYPSIIQAEDGSLHASYSYNLKTIKHVHFNEAWVQQGD